MDAVSPKTQARLQSVQFRQATGALALVCGLYLLPVLLTRNPPLHDYMFHLARIYILEHWQGSQALQSLYNVGSFILPNIAFDVVALLFSKVTSLEFSGRVFIGLTLLLQLTGCMALHRSIHGRYSLWPLAAGLFLYNWIFLFGFLNYLFGLGVLLWAIAIWIGLSHRAAWGYKIVVGTTLSVILFFCHLITCGLFAVVVAGYELQRAFDIRRSEPYVAVRNLIVGASIFILPIFLYFMSSTAGEAANRSSHNIRNLLRTPLIFLRGVLTGNWSIDIVTTLAVVACLAIFFFRGRLTFARSMYLPLAMLVATFLIMPHELFGGWGADTRLPVFIVFVIIASSQPVISSIVWQRIAGLAIVATMVLQSAILTYSWQSYDKVIDAFRANFESLPANSVLFSASENALPSFQDLDLALWHPPLPHVVTLAVLQGRGIFVPQTWAHVGQQPITTTTQYAALYRFQTNAPIQVFTPEDLNDAVESIKRLGADTHANRPEFLLLLYPQRLNLALPAHTSVVASNPYGLLLAIE